MTDRAIGPESGPESGRASGPESGPASPYHYAETPGRPGAPLVVTLHGTGGDERQFHALAQELVPGAHVISPRGDVSERGALRFFRRSGEGVYDMADLARATRAMAAFLAARRAEAGAQRVLAFGYSNGANILASVLFAEPALVDGAALLHPLIPFAPQARPGLAGKPVLITAGRRDPICPPAQTEALAAFLNDQGA